MTAHVIDGKKFAAGLVDKIAATVADIKAAHNVTPCLAVVLVGTDPASQVYVRNKGEQTKAAGMLSIEHKLPATASEAQLLTLIDSMNKDEAIDGILVQLPLPKHINEASVIQAIAPEKDVDGFHVVNAGLLATGQSGMVPCTPLGCLLLLQDHLGDLSGAHAVVLGRSNIVGKPMAQLLTTAHSTTTIAHSRSRDLSEICQQADILVVAVGRPEMVTGDWIKPGATVIDVGINRVSNPTGANKKYRLTGDVDFASAAPVAGAITPVPGGVGPMTIACLLRNTLVAGCQRHNIKLDGY
jgi:methylenetetrahydrofolate dehydrogenase (NADP+)/methenyltetrahydrofolate cyclohydrolase